MIKKSLTALAVAGLLTLGGASAAFAGELDPEEYPVTASCTANPNPIAVGATSVITCTGLEPGVTGTLSVTGPGVTDATLSSIVFAAATGTDSVIKTVTPEGTVAVNFVGPAAGNFAVSLSADNGQSGSATVTVTAASTGGGGLPATGGTVPAAAIWLGVGAIGIGGIAVAAAVARRRAKQTN